jgi:hypothetical protein
LTVSDRFEYQLKQLDCISTSFEDENAFSKLLMIFKSYLAANQKSIKRLAYGLN